MYKLFQVYMQVARGRHVESPRRWLLLFILCIRFPPSVYKFKLVYTIYDLALCLDYLPPSHIHDTGFYRAYHHPQTNNHVEYNFGAEKEGYRELAVYWVNTFPPGADNHLGFCLVDNFCWAECLWSLGDSIAILFPGNNCGKASIINC
jgi:hypothetical protein